jgi:hypothetical protein
MEAKKPSQLSILRGNDDVETFREKIKVALRCGQIRKDKANSEWRQMVANSTFDNPNGRAINPFSSLQKMSGYE